MKNVKTPVGILVYQISTFCITIRFYLSYRPKQTGTVKCTVSHACLLILFFLNATWPEVGNNPALNNTSFSFAVWFTSDNIYSLPIEIGTRQNITLPHQHLFYWFLIYSHYSGNVFDLLVMANGKLLNPVSFPCMH